MISIKNKYSNPCKVLILSLFVLFTPPGLFDLFDKIHHFLMVPDSFLHVSIILFIWFLTWLSIVTIPWLRFPYRLLLGLFVFINALIFSSYKKITGSTLYFYDMVSMMTTPTGAKNAIVTYTDKIIPVALMLMPLLFGMLAFNYKKNASMKFKIIPVMSYLSCVLLINAIVIYKKSGYSTGGFPGYSVPSSLASLYLYQSSLPHKYKDRSLVYDGKKPLVNNIVLIVDESIRYDFIDINKNRGTTPASRHLTNAINFGKAISYSNCSQYSQILLRSAASYKNFVNDIRARYFIWDIAQLAGYQSFLMDNQTDGSIHSDFFTQEEHEKFTNIISSQYSDEQLAKKLVNKISNTPGKNLYYIIKQGAHFPYSNDGMKLKFTPNIGSKKITNATDRMIKNSYKNKIFVNTNAFFDVLIKAQLKNTLFIYTSDHGQNIKGINKIATHCNSQETSVHKNEGLVPLVVFSDYLINEDPWIQQLIKIKRLKGHIDIAGIYMHFMGYSDKSINKFMNSKKLHDDSILGFAYGNVSGYFGTYPEIKLIT